MPIHIFQHIAEIEQLDNTVIRRKLFDFSYLTWLLHTTHLLQHPYS